ncbi:hypothetical protein [Neptunitalea chrysea]|nr:hypothetical protein [Neptunitalea chrysea]
MKSITTLSIIALLFCICLLSCSEDDANTGNVNPCSENSVLVSPTDYSATPSYQSSVVSAIIDGDCLTVMVSSSGCDGSTWEASFFAANPQTSNGQVTYDSRVDIINLEICLALPSVEFVFDLTNLQVAGSNSVTLSIDGLNSDLLYTY